MRKIYVLLGCMLLSQMSNNLSAQVIFSQDFSSATGTTPPTGWTNNDISEVDELWEFDNPGERPMVFPISSPAAIFDSDNWGGGGDFEDVALESPVFDASAITDNIFLTFDHDFVNYGSFGGGAYFVEVFDGTDWVEVLTGDEEERGHVVLDITTAVNGAADAQVRFRWTGDFSYWWIVDNILVEQVSCLPVANLLADNATASSFEVSWDAGTGTAWDIQWGLPGFVPGTGTQIGSVIATTSNPYTVSGLSVSTVYDVYVKVVCGTGHSLWTKVAGTTLCGPIANFPWFESFEAVPELGEGFYPHCWSASEEEWYSDTYTTFITEAPARSGANYAAIMFYGDDTLWTPEFQLTAGKQYEFKLHYFGDGSSGWQSKLVVHNNQTSTTSAVTGGTILTSSDEIEQVYKEKVICYSPATSGVYKFGIQATSNGDPYVLAMDDFYLLEREGSAGTNGTATVCQTGGLVDLNDVIVKDDENGFWSFAPNQSVIENDSLFNPAFVPETTLTVNYITLGCLEDTATATITIVGPSTAGQEGSISVCKNEPVDLLSGLTGTVDHGGNWYNPQHNLLTSSQIMAPNFPGQYNFEYVVSNGVCPNDTSGVVVTVTSCDWLSLEESALEAVTIYPNPSKGLVYIESNASVADLKLTVTDINGRTIETGVQSVAAGTQSVNLASVQRGTYFFKLSNGSAEKVYRVVIQ